MNGITHPKQGVQRRGLTLPGGRPVKVTYLPIQLPTYPVARLITQVPHQIPPREPIIQKRNSIEGGRGHRKHSIRPHTRNVKSLQRIVLATAAAAAAAAVAVVTGPGPEGGATDGRGGGDAGAAGSSGEDGGRRAVGTTGGRAREGGTRGGGSEWDGCWRLARGCAGGGNVRAG